MQFELTGDVGQKRLLLTKAVLRDPAKQDGSRAEALVRQAFSDIYRVLRIRFLIFVNFPLSSLDQLRLEKRIHDTGIHQTMGPAVVTASNNSTLCAGRMTIPARADIA